MPEKIASYKIKVNGVVQGVGFRPHVYRLAQDCNLNGWVLNSASGVLIQAEGPLPQLEEFKNRLVEEAPPLASIRSFEVEEVACGHYQDFTIKASLASQENTALIPPDIAVCTDCRREVRDPHDRRFGYPFTNCTNCGPRFTIIEDLPYDRPYTTMKHFTMCPQCQREYDDPSHRRFHAQPNSCPQCGPHITIFDRHGKQTAASVTDLLKAGYIVAVKGLGAFHLACAAHHREAAENLRKRKHRDAKPFALMVQDLQAAYKYCTIRPEEEKYLTSPAAPIVILEYVPHHQLPTDLISPGLNTCGIMLPYTPLHYLLFADGLDALIMTSANISDQPLIIDNQQALEKLNGIADYFLVHNRDIYNPCDDSVMSVTGLKTPHFFRRARGYVPLGLPLPHKSEPILALGGEMKNTFCITRGEQAFLSQHWGDLSYYHNFLHYQQGIRRFQKMLAVEPQILVHDLHPDYQTTRLAKAQTGKNILAIQHHHAHLAAVMAENGLEGEVLGLICDGSGYGADGHIWGGEILQGGYQSYKRLAHLAYQPLLGGDVTSRKPYRMAFIYLQRACGTAGIRWAEKYLPALPPEEKQWLAGRLTKDQQEIMTSSCGRLFDAVSALLGICSLNDYEGQAAALLEAQAKRYGPVKQFYPYAINTLDGDIIEMSLEPMWAEIIADRQQQAEEPFMAAKFHHTLVLLFTQVLTRLRAKTGINRAVLSGGVFHNQILLQEITRSLEQLEFQVYHHRQVSPGDGGISLGQAVIASEVNQICV